MLLVTVLLLVTLVLNGLLLIGYRQRNMQSYLAAYFDKQTLLQNTPSPRIILVGGSSVAFGFDSHELSKITGMPVVNMGLAVDLGVRFILESIKPYLNEGDIIILSPEYQSIITRRHGGDLLVQLVILDPQTLKYFSNFTEYWEMVQALPSIHTSAVKNMLEDLKLRHCLICTNRDLLYFRTALDPTTGDILNNDPASYPVNKEVLVLPFDVNTRAVDNNIDYLNHFYNYAESQKVKLHYFYPSTLKTTDELTLARLMALDKKIRQSLEIPILNSIEDSQYDSQYILDSAYHLNKQGQVINTARLYETLCGVDPDLHCAIP